MIADYVQLMRPPQWVKNVVVLAGPAFGMKLVADAASLVHTALAFACFCLVSSAIYTINDVADREQDRFHPEKSARPVARGAISPPAAVLFGTVLAAVALLVAWFWLPGGCFALLAGYLVLMLVYSFGLKRLMILDVIAIAVGFVLRAWAGAEAVDVLVSPWLIVCTFTLCLFLGFGKRRCELAVIGNLEDAREHRVTLERYTPELLNHMISISAGIAVMTFLLYTMDPSHPAPFPKHHLVYTIPLVVYGVFRYAMLIESGRLTGPTDIIINDRPFLGTIILWTLVAAGIIYEDKVLALLGRTGN